MPDLSPDKLDLMDRLWRDMRRGQKRPNRERTGASAQVRFCYDKIAEVKEAGASWDEVVILMEKAGFILRGAQWTALSLRRAFCREKTRRAKHGAKIIKTDLQTAPERPAKVEAAMPEIKQEKPWAGADYDTRKAESKTARVDFSQVQSEVLGITVKKSPNNERG